MTPKDALAAARRVGIRFRIDGEYMLMEARRAPPFAVVQELRRHKSHIKQLLIEEAEQRLADMHERAGILEFDAGLNRDEAEVLAMTELLEQLQ